ncbi:MAG: cytochrome c, partial [Planctomycetaceae bacterium]|nr:cytochrome c [Planctomycetaceae bacterium]
QAVADDRSEFMREKLAMTGRIVEGLATEDFDLIRQGATELNSLSEHAAWKAPNDPYYEYYSGNFSQAARQLITAAESNSVEKATYAYMHVTVSCTACHQHVRGRVRVAR